MEAMYKSDLYDDLSECRCLYRSIARTYTSENTPEMPVPVQRRDRYGHWFTGVCGNVYRKCLILNSLRNKYPQAPCYFGGSADSSFITNCPANGSKARVRRPATPAVRTPDHTPFQEAGTGASRKSSVFFTGWMKRMERAWREMPPSGLERGAPYLRSPLMGQPM